MSDKDLSSLKKICAWSAGLITLISGLIVMLGWIINNDLLRSVLPGCPMMRVNTAIAFIFIGLSLCLKLLKRRSPFVVFLSQFSALFVALIGFLTLSEYVFSIDLGIDELLFKAPQGYIYTINPGRMALNTSITTALVGIALLILNKTKPYRLNFLLLGLLGSFTLIFGMMGIVSFSTGTVNEKGLWNITVMALPTAVLFTLIGALLLFFGINSRQWKLSLDKNIISWFGLGLMAMCLTSILSYRSSISTMDNEKLVLKTNNRIAEIKDVLSDLKDTETGQRGYLLTGRNRYLQPYQQAVKDLENHFKILHGDMENKASQHEKVEMLRSLIGTKLNELRQTINIKDQKGNESALNLVLTDQGKAAMDSIRTLCSEMIASENLELQSAKERSNSLTQNMLYVLPIGTFFGIFALLASLFIVNIENRKRRESEDNLRKAHEQLEDKVRERTKELSRSNQELEQFAYVASHDLQEPLRMISSYSELLGRRYKGKLDSDADEFIFYVTDGARRMQRMISDLLSFSRVNSQGKSFQETNLCAILTEAQKNLQTVIKETSARIICDELPVVYADSSQMTRLFQNLIENALKYRSNDIPEIHISAEKTEDKWTICVRDNGIGIDPEYNEKIFQIFQRLHTKQKYSGTGIGLAVCKRIVERHGGEIWVKSKLGEGAAFYFTIKNREIKDDFNRIRENH